MVETITPVVYGGSKPRWLAGVAMMAIGATVTAGLFGAFLGFVGSVFGAPWGPIGMVAVALIALLYLARETVGLKIPVLQAKRQVPEWWRTFFSPIVASVLYGGGLGIGFFTYLTYGTLVVVAAIAVALGNPGVGVLLLVPFALARSLTVLIAYGSDSGEASNRLITRLARIGRTKAIRLVNVIALLALALTAGAASAAAITAEDGDGSNAGLFAVALVGMVFGWAGISKVAGFVRWRTALAGYGIPVKAQGAIAISVPLLEIMVAIVAIGGWGRLASGAALVLLAVFSLAIVRARSIHGNRLDCGCFGSRRFRDYRAMLLRNGLLAAVAVVGLIAGPQTEPTVPGIDLVPLVLSVAGIVLVTWVAGVVSMALRGDRT